METCSLQSTPPFQAYKGISWLTVGYRLGKSLDQIIPLFIKCCGGTSEVSDLNETQEAFYNDLREHCFPGLESFVLRCPNETAPHVSAILQLS